MEKCLSRYPCIKQISSQPVGTQPISCSGTEPQNYKLTLQNLVSVLLFDDPISVISLGPLINRLPVDIETEPMLVTYSLLLITPAKF